MSIKDITSIINPYETININGVETRVKKLTVKEMRQYDSIRNKGLGTVKTGLGRRSNEQSANIDIVKFGETQHDADVYLVKTSFTFDDNVCTDEDVEQLYDLFNPVVQELRRVNNITVDEDATSESSELAEDIKK